MLNPGDKVRLFPPNPDAPTSYAWFVRATRAGSDVVAVVRDRAGNERAVHPAWRVERS